MCFGQKNENTTTTKQKKKLLPKTGIEPGTSRNDAGCLTSGHYSKGLNLKTKAECACHTFSTNSFFLLLYFFKCMVTTFDNFSYLLE